MSGGGGGVVQTKKRKKPSGHLQVKDVWVQETARECGIIALKIRVKNRGRCFHFSERILEPPALEEDAEQ